MSIERSTEIPIKRPTMRYETHYYATGGKGNPKLIGWSRGTQQEKENATNDHLPYRPSLKKEYNYNHSLTVVPITINRRGRIIRYKSHN
jgi:hypothetical protein